MPENEEGGGAAVLDFTDLAAAAAAPAAPIDPATVKLDGDNIPEALRGKTLADVLSVQTELQRALAVARDTNDALRQSSEALTASRQQQAPVVQQPVAEPELTKEQLKALYDEDPFAYQQHMFTQMDKKIQKQVSSSIAPFASTTASVSESQARQKFTEEFSVLGTEINQVLSQIPDKGVLAQPGAWDELLYYVRGKNLDKLMEARTKKANDSALEEARKREANGVGSVNDGSRRGVSTRQTITELTPQQKDAARVLGITEAEYKQYYF